MERVYPDHRVSSTEEQHDIHSCLCTHAIWSDVEVFWTSNALNAWVHVSGIILHDDV